MSGTKNSGRRNVPQEDKIRFWEARAAGISIKEACKIAGIHYNTGQKWDAKRRKLQTENELAQFDVKKAVAQSGRERAELRQSLDGFERLRQHHEECQQPARGNDQKHHLVRG